MKTNCQKQYPDFTQEVDKLSAEELKGRIVQLQQALQESETHKENNDSLKQARAVVNELAGPYKDVKKAVSIKTQYILELIEEKGK